MRNKKIWLRRYSGQTVEQLLSLEPTHRIDSLILRIEEALYKKAHRMGPDSLSAAEWTIIAIESLEREVNNGGIKQFLEKSSRKYASQIADALRRIGCPRTADLLAAAIGSLQLSDHSSAAITAAVATPDVKRDDLLANYTQQYFQHSESIEWHLFQFIRTNQDSIKITA